MEDRLDLPLQPRGHHCLRDPIGHSRHTQNPDPIAVRLRYLHGQHRRRKVTARGHSIPDLVQIVLQIVLELLERAPVHPGAPLFAFTFSQALCTSHFEISNDLTDDFSSPIQTPPEPRLG